MEKKIPWRIREGTKVLWLRRVRAQRHVASACDVWYLIFYFLVAKKKKKTFGGKCGAADLIVEGVSAEKIIEKIFIILRYFFFACFLVCLF